jgi:hypothetical protein
VKLRDFYALVVLFLPCTLRDSLTTQKARTRWSDLVVEFVDLWLATDFLTSFVVTLIRASKGDEAIRQALIRHAKRDPGVGEATRRWLAGETVDVYYVLQEASRYYEYAWNLYCWRCTSKWCTSLKSRYKNNNI